MFGIKNPMASFSSTTSPFDEGTGEFNPIDVDAVKKDLRLAKRAAENGRKGIPSETSESKDAIATDIDAYLGDLVSRAKDKFDNRIKAMDSLTKSQTEGSEQEITELYDSGRNDLRKSARDHYNNLFTAKRNWILGEEEFSEFRKKHKRIGPARYPQGGEKTRIYGLLFFFT